MDISAMPQQSRGFRPLPFWTGIVLVGLPVLLAIIAPMISPLSPVRQSLRLALAAPDLAAPFGYDHLGRSMMARLAEALRLSLTVSAASALSAAAIGLGLGVTASRMGGMTDRLLTLLADSFMAIPGLLIVLMIGVIVPWKPLAFWLGLTLVLWIEFFRLARAASRPIFASPAVQASGLLGFGKAYIFRRHVWPELAPVMLTSTAFGMATCIMTIAALGFVSAGVRPPTPELGQMMVELMPYWREAPWALLQPVAAIFSLILGLNLIAGSRA